MNVTEWYLFLHPVHWWNKLVKKMTIAKIIAFQKGGGFLLYSFYKGFYIMHNQILIPLRNTKKEETYLKIKIKT